MALAASAAAATAAAAVAAAATAAASAATATATAAAASAAGAAAASAATTAAHGTGNRRHFDRDGRQVVGTHVNHLLSRRVLSPSNAIRISAFDRLSKVVRYGLEAVRRTGQGVMRIVAGAVPEADGNHLRAQNFYYSQRGVLFRHVYRHDFELRLKFRQGRRRNG